MFKKLLVPLDKSELAEKALPYALSLAEQYDAELLLLVALQKVPVYVMGGEMGAYSYVTADSELKREAETAQVYLDALVEKYGQSKIVIRTLV